MHSDTDYLRAALTAGRDGYVLKARLSLDIVPALQAALRETVHLARSGAGGRGMSRC